MNSRLLAAGLLVAFLGLGGIALVAAGSPRPGDTLVLTGATILPMTSDTVLRDRTLVIGDGVVADIYRTGSRSDPAGATVRDLSGRYVLPGLIDAHVHLREPPESLVLFPAVGVTTVVNLEGEPAHLRLRDSVRAAGSLAPRIVSSGPYLERIAATPAEARAEVRRQRDAGYDLVKIHGEMEEDAFLAALDEARAAGLPVVAHRPDNLPTDVVLESGLTALAHVEELLGSSLLEEPVGLSADSADSIGRAVASSGTALITTFGFFAGMRDQATDRFYAMITRPELAYVSPDRRHAWLYDGHREYIPSSDLPWYETAVDDLRRVILSVHDAGGTVVAGTDTPLEFTVPGFSLHEELRQLRAAGLTAYDVLRAATVNAADLVERPDLGRVEVGAAADLVIVDADPRDSLAVLRRPHAVVVRGEWHGRRAIERETARLAATYAREEVRRAAGERVIEEITAVLDAEGVEAAVAEIRRLREEPHLPDVTEGQINTLGYRLLADDDPEAAIEVFRLNVELHPNSANAHDSLGEAYLGAGRPEAAERSYRRALELDPTMDSARRALRRIEGRADLER
ncbi:MAG: amidohydrolase family protein [Gemmatimonadota bacterium]